MSPVDRSVSGYRDGPLPAVAWLSFASAALAWLFDAMDLTIFLLILFPSVSELTGSADPALVSASGGLALAAKLLAWGAGGIAFGVLADRVGRARTMVGAAHVAPIGGENGLCAQGRRCFRSPTCRPCAVWFGPETRGAPLVD